MQNIGSFVCGSWIAADEGARPIANAVTGEVFAEAGNDGLDFAAMLEFAREKGGPALRAISFHDRARMLKAVALYLTERKQALYDISFATGATQNDHLLDIDGGIGTTFVFASKGRREMPDAQVLLDGNVEQLGRKGDFVGHHVYTPKRGVAVQINAFNFPVWGMLEKLAPAILAGVPSIVKPATVSCYVTEACVRMIEESGLLPLGAVQLVTGGLGKTLEMLDCQDMVAFTGSAATARTLRTGAGLIEKGVGFTAEQDSLNASILGPDAVEGTPEFDLFIKEVAREMTTKAGQKCTAIRRVIVPKGQVDAVIGKLSQRLAGTVIGDPQAEGVRMGALVSTEQRADVLAKASEIATEAERVFGDTAPPEVVGADAERGAFLSPMLYHCADPHAAVKLHETEAFGPVSTIMPYDELADAITLANRGQGALVASVITHDPQVAREVTLGAAAWHGRLYFNDRKGMSESTGHGSTMPHLTHGGPGRAGGGEELGGIRAVKHYMQRTSVQGSPDLLAAIGQRWVPGAAKITRDTHPFRHRFGQLQLGQSLRTPSRKITMQDIEHFAAFTGDTFYAHLDEAAAARNPFFPGRVAHGYLLISFAAGLFVEPAEGPVLANTGLDGLRFMKPVEPEDSITADLTVMHKTPRNEDYGEVRWHVRLTNQDEELVAEYELLTMVAY